MTLDAGGRPSVVLDLNDMVNLTTARDSLTVTPATKRQILSSADRRYGGAREVGEVTDNGTISWSCLVKGSTADECIAKLEGLLAQAEAAPIGLLIEWRPDGASQSALYEVRGTASTTSKYTWAQFSGAQSLVVDVSVPIAPLALGLPYDILDVFALDTRSDYTYDSGAQGNEEVAGELKAAANLTTENRAIHTARGYQYADNQQTAKYTPRATITGWKGGVVLKRSAATTYLEVYVDDNGTNSRLRIDKVLAGVRTNLATTNLAARVVNGSAYWVRGRIEGNVVTAEHFTSAPTPMGVPTTTNNDTLAAGTERETFGEGVKGAPGRVWIPQTAGASCAEYAVEPYTYRNVTTPVLLSLGGTISGDAPAKAAVTVTPVGGTEPPIWALLAWSKTPASGLAQAPIGVIEAESAGNLSGWAVTADGTEHADALLKDAEAAVGKSYAASWPVDPSLLARDAFTTEIAIEVWARVLLSGSILTPTLTLSVRPQDGTNYGAARYTDEWGSTGKPLTAPSRGTVARFVRLGTLRMLVDPLRPRAWLLWLTGAVGEGSSGAWGVDYLLLAPANSRACSPSSKANDAAYPVFVASTAETSKTIRHDLSALVAKPPAYGHPDHGLGGQLLELAPGSNQLLVKFSSLVPDDPTSNATTEKVTHSPTVHVAVTPRWQLARSGS